MTIQRIFLALVVLLAAGLAGAFYMNWKTLGQLRTVKAFVEGQVLADAVAACERAQSATPFKWTGARQTAVIGVNSVKLNKDTIIPGYTLVADSVYCDYDPIKKKADIGSNFLEREFTEVEPELERGWAEYSEKNGTWISVRDYAAEGFRRGRSKLDESARRAVAEQSARTTNELDDRRA